MRPREKSSSDDSLYAGGRNSAVESIKAGLAEKLYIKKGKKDGRLLEIAEDAARLGILTEEMDEFHLDRLVPGVRHQGIVARLKPYEYASLEEVFRKVQQPDPILVLLDGLEDVRNLGAIIRTAECAGAAAVLLPQHRSCQVTAVTMKTAAGACSYMPVCRIGNIRQTLETLKEKGFWVVGADMDGDSLYYEADLKGPLVIVMGAEGKGLGTLTKKMCDFCVRIPMKGQVSSLNVSVAASLLLYEAVRQRG